jgi:hypothetical protein
MENELVDMNNKEYKKCNNLAKFITSLKYETATKDDFEKIREILEKFDFDYECGDAAFSKDMKQATQDLFDELSKKFETAEQYNCNHVAEFIASLKYETASKDDFEKIRKILAEFDFDKKCHAAFSKDLKQATQDLFDELSKKFDETMAEKYLNLFESFGGRKSKKRGSKKRGSKKRGSKKRGSKKRGSKKRGSKKRGSKKRGFKKVKR